MRQNWRKRAQIALLAMVGGVAILAQADSQVQNSSSQVDDMIDGKMPAGGRPPAAVEPDE